MKGIERREKCYIEVIAHHALDGSVEPLALVWEDGRVFAVDRVIEKRRAASMRVGGHGLRSTVSICGRERFVWLDDAGWYVEKIVSEGMVSLVEPGAGRAAASEREEPEERCMTSFVPVGFDEIGEIMDSLRTLARRTGRGIDEA